MRNFIFPLLIATLPTGALAECPVAADLAQGVRFELATGGSWDLRATSSRDRHVTLVWDPQYDAQSLTYERGIYLTELAIPVSGFTSTTEFTPSLRRAPSPAPGAQWEAVTTTVTDGVTRRDALRVAWGAAEVVRFGSCEYQSIPMQWIVQGTDGVAQVNAYSYLPEFGAVVLNGQGFGITWTITGVSAL